MKPKKKPKRIRYPNRVGHPVTKYTPQKIKEIKKKLEKYCKDTQIPIIAEFAYLNDIRKQTLYELPELADSIKKIIEKKETMLERGSLTNQLNTSQAIFSLKQLGWRDRFDINHNIPEDVENNLKKFFGQREDLKNEDSEGRE